MEFPITINNGRCDLRPLLAYLTSLNGTFVVSVEKPRRTNPQNRWLWGCIYPMLLVGLNAMGWRELTNAEDVHAFLGQYFRTQEQRNEEDGETCTIVKSTASMTTEEMTEYCETLRAFAREYCNIEIPDPDPEYYGK